MDTILTLLRLRIRPKVLQEAASPLLSNLETYLHYATQAFAEMAEVSGIPATALATGFVLLMMLSIVLIIRYLRPKPKIASSTDLGKRVVLVTGCDTGFGKVRRSEERRTESSSEGWKGVACRFAPAVATSNILSSRFAILGLGPSLRSSRV